MGFWTQIWGCVTYHFYERRWGEDFQRITVSGGERVHTRKLETRDRMGEVIPGVLNLDVWGTTDGSFGGPFASKEGI